MQSRKQLARLAEALGGIPIWGCLPGSAAQRLGVRYGDVLLSVNGQRTSTVDEFVDARASRADMAEVVVFRDGDELTLRLELESATPLTDEQMHAVALQVAEARLAPTDHPPPSEPSYGGSSMT
jgi:hypothetical protein